MPPPEKANPIRTSFPLVEMVGPPIKGSVAANGILIGALWIVAQPHKAAANKLAQVRRQNRIVSAITGPTQLGPYKPLNYDDFETRLTQAAIIGQRGATIHRVNTRFTLSKMRPLFMIATESRHRSKLRSRPRPDSYTAKSPWGSAAETIANFIEEAFWPLLRFTAWASGTRQPPVVRIAIREAITKKQ